MFLVFMIGEKVEMSGFKTLEEAHHYCEERSYPILLIFEGMTLDDAFNDRFTEPLALYINGKRYDVAEREG